MKPNGMEVHKLPFCIRRSFICSKLHVPVGDSVGHTTPTSRKHLETSAKEESYIYYIFKMHKHIWHQHVMTHLTRYFRTQRGTNPAQFTCKDTKVKNLNWGNVWALIMCSDKISNVSFLCVPTIPTWPCCAFTVSFHIKVPLFQKSLSHFLFMTNLPSSTFIEFAACPGSS